MVCGSHRNDAGEVLLVAVHCNQMLQFRKRTLQSAVFCVRHSACVCVRASGSVL